MKLINKHNFFSIVCIVYTIISIYKLISEYCGGMLDSNYTENIISIFVISLLATAMLAVHNYTSNIPILIIFVAEYMILLGLIMGYMWIEGHYIPLHRFAYRDLFRSFTIPYVIFIFVYYINYRREIAKANMNLEEIKKEKFKNSKE